MKPSLVPRHQGLCNPAYLGLVWFDLVAFQVSTFYYVWNWSERLVPALAGHSCDKLITIYNFHQKKGGISEIVLLFSLKLR